MKLVITFISCLVCMQLFACNKNSEMSNSPESILITENMKLKIIIGSSAFTGTFYNNATANTFKSRLPMTINMSELNGNEKYFDLRTSLPTNASNPAGIQAGDLMLYGSNTLVLFYKSFATSYSYTAIGRFDDVSGLTAALGSGNVEITFALQ